MNIEILSQLRKLSKEEHEILHGKKEIDTDTYMDRKNSSVIDSQKLLEKNQLITIRTHTRFVPFPKHRHNYVEMVYMCEGQTVHYVNGSKIVLKRGELLLMNQFAQQQIEVATKEDVAVNFIILPEFFERVFGILDQEDNLIREFLINCLKNADTQTAYLHFKVADHLPVQNLLENLIWTLLNHQKDQRRINQTTMGLLFLHLLTLVEKIEGPEDNFEQSLLLKVYQYIEENYRTADLGYLATELGYDSYWLSRFILKNSGSNFIDLVQQKRLQHATSYLQYTSLSISEIANQSGYSNMSYFYKIFRKTYGISPKEYREEVKKKK